MKIVLQNLTKIFPSRNKKSGEEVVAVNNFDFTIPDGKLIGLLGPSGCGKSTTLYMISGLQKPSSGKIFFGEDDVTDLSTENRGIGLVFQNYALYPHLTVKQNILFPLQNLRGKDKMTKEAMLERAHEAARLVQIEELLERKPSELSGGQQQRVAIARALAPRPRLLLLDEPLSALDAWSRASIGEQLRTIQEASGVTTVMVTHDRQEALSLSDYVVVMNAGHVEQADAPNEIYDRPASEFVATFVGGMNIVRMPLIREGAATGLRYADVKLHRATEAALARPYTFVGKVQAVQFMGDTVRVKVLMNDFQTTITADALRINTDRSVFALHSLIAVELPESAWRTWGAQ